MELSEYERLRKHEQAYWWHVGRRDLIRSLLVHNVPQDAERPGLDVGCGTGSNLDLLAPWGRFVGTEVEPDLWANGRARPSRPVLLARGEELPFADGTFGICTFFDVLEHIRDEDVFLAEVRRVLSAGGLVVLTVPAYMALWSHHDESLHHFRRYVRRTLTDALERNGLEVLRMTYAMASILPPVAVVRWASRFGSPAEGAGSSYVPTPEPLNSLLVGALRLEAAWLRHADLPFGTSLLALARRHP